LPTRTSTHESNESKSHKQKECFSYLSSFLSPKTKKKDDPTESSRLISLSDGFEGEGVKKIATDYYY